ncbi:MAG: M23 family metallopeptidase [Treponema sp.]|jgi:murein DD-endopeptidase MepM/ murein hydrolase activator NlpD|nr:M23 family metallopeptidase [Treponema sp.]
MASVHEYKKFENTVTQKLKKLVAAVLKGLGGGFKSLFRVITQRYTIVLVPHTEKKVYNFHVTLFSFCCVLLILAGIVGTFFWYGASYNTTRDALAVKDSRLKDTQASLDQLRDEVAQLLRQTKGFQATLSSTLSALGADSPSADAAASNSGDLSAFFDVRETAEGTLREVEDIRELAEYLSSAAGPVKEIGTLLASQSALLKEIPNIWPIKGGIGHVSMYFGQNTNPFTGQYYIHKGIDLSTYRQGDPIVATADGQVVTMDYDPGFGNYLIIKHKHGFYTRYAHLQSFRVLKGQRVQQGEVIGYIGNTGLSTGPHVHYEVHIGSDVVDPYKYLNIRSNVSARTGR